MKRTILIGLLAVLAITESWSRNVSDSVRVYYRQGHREVDIYFRENRTGLERFLRSVREMHEAGSLENIVIRSWASPEGVNRLNEVLSERRADS